MWYEETKGGTMYKSKRALISELKTQLAERDHQAIKGLMKLYSFQQENEKSSGYSINVNGIGFNRLDSQILNYFAQFVGRGGLDEYQMQILHTLMPKYARQLIEYSIYMGYIVKTVSGYEVGEEYEI